MPVDGVQDAVALAQRYEQNCEVKVMDIGVSTGSTAASGKPTRGKDQLGWSDEVWHMIDVAVNEEITRSRMGAKFLPAVYVHKKRTTVDADIVVPPQAPLTDPSLSVEEATTKRIQQYMAQIRLSRAQMEAEGEHDADLVTQIAAKSDATAGAGAGASNASSLRRPHRASTAVSLALQAAKLLAQVEDLVLFNGASAVAYHPLFTTNLVQALDPNLLTNLDGGLMNILPATLQAAAPFTFQPAASAAAANANVLQLPASQIVLVRPSQTAAVTGALPTYRENSLNAVAQAVAILQGLGYNDNYALVLHTVPYADLHQALQNTLIQPVEPISHLVTAGIFGTGNLPPFPGASSGLPTHILNPPVAAGGAFGLVGTPIVSTSSTTGTPIAPISTLPGYPSTPGAKGAPATPANVLFTGFLVSLSGNSMDVVRGLMDDGLDVCLTFNQKSANENYIFNESQRLTLRLKDLNAVIGLLFLDI